jgi:hypothetical protein
MEETWAGWGLQRRQRIAFYILSVSTGIFQKKVG